MWKRACGLSEVEATEQRMMQVDVDGLAVLVVASSEGVFATGAKCTHFGAPLVKGVRSGERLVCPWHGACFNMKSGDIEDAPGLDSVESYPAKVENGAVWVQVPEGATGRRTVSHSCPTASKEHTTVVIGGGAAGQSAVETLRMEGYAGRVVLVCKENVLPYDRTKLSKALEPDASKLELRPAAFYEQLGIQVRLGVEATHLDAKAKSCSLSDGTALSYDEVVVCTGSHPFNIPVPGHDLPNVVTLRAPAQAGAIRDSLNKDSKVVLIGSGFIGLEVATVLVKSLGVGSVTVVSMEDVPMSRVFGERVGKVIRGVHESNGVQFLMSAKLQGYKEEGGKAVGVLVEGRSDMIPADLILVGAGVRLNTKFLENVELAKDGSVVVDRGMRSASGIYAAGDVARFPYALQSGSPATRIEHWSVAQNQAKVAARNIAGKVSVYDSCPYFWSVQFPGSFRYVGHSETFDAVHVDGEPEKDGKFVAYYIKGEAIEAVATFGRDPVASAFAELFRMGKVPTLSTIKAGFDPVAALDH